MLGFVRRAKGPLIAAVSLLLHSGRALAFKAEGHEAIEARAHAELLAAPGGEEVIERLVADGYLVVRGEGDWRECAKRKGETCFVADSGDVDADFILQVGYAGQCAHFMAGPEDDALAAPENAEPPPTKWPYMLGYAALPRCRRYIGHLADRAVSDARPEKRRSAVRALVHSIVDSYSDAHVERRAGCDAAHWEKSRIVRLKVWDLVAFYRWFRATEPERYHAASDDRDEDYLSPKYRPDPKGECVAVRHPERLLDSACLSPRAQGAALATMELLRTIASLRKERVQVAVTSPAWQRFVDDHFTLTADADGHDGTLQKLNEWQRSHDGKLWNFDACAGDCYGSGACPPAGCGEVQNPRCERDFETRLEDPLVWASLGATGWSHINGGLAKSISIGMRHYPRVTCVNSFLAGIAPLRWSPYGQADLLAVLPTPGRSFDALNFRVGLVSAVIHPALALSLFELQWTQPLEHRGTFGTRVFELALRSSGLSYHLPEHWALGVALGSIHTRTALQPKSCEWAPTLSLSYGAGERDLL